MFYDQDYFILTETLFVFLFYCFFIALFKTHCLPARLVCLIVYEKYSICLYQSAKSKNLTKKKQLFAVRFNLN